MSLIASGIALVGKGIGAAVGKNKGDKAADEQNLLEQQNYTMQYENTVKQREAMDAQNSMNMMQTFEPMGQTQTFWAQNGALAPIYQGGGNMLGYKGGGKMGPYNTKSYPDRVRSSRKGSRKNKDGSESTVLMASSDNKAFPTLFQNEDGEWFELPWKEAMKEAEKRGELYEFTSNKEAEEFAEGSWKDEPMGLPGKNWTAPPGAKPKSGGPIPRRLRYGGRSFEHGGQHPGQGDMKPYSDAFAMTVEGGMSTEDYNEGEAMRERITEDDRLRALGPDGEWNNQPGRRGEGYDDPNKSNSEYWNENSDDGIIFDARTQLSLGLIAAAPASGGIASVGKAAIRSLTKPGSTVLGKGTGTVNPRGIPKAGKRSAGKKMAKDLNKELYSKVETEEYAMGGYSPFPYQDQSRTMINPTTMYKSNYYHGGMSDNMGMNAAHPFGPVGVPGYKQGGRTLLQMVQAGNPQAYWPSANVGNYNNPGNVGRHRDNMDRRYPTSSQNFQGGGNLLQMVQAGDPNAYWMNNSPNNLNNPGNVGRHRDNMDQRYPGSSQNFSKPNAQQGAVVPGTPIEGRPGYFNDQQGESFSYYADPPPAFNTTGEASQDVMRIGEEINLRNPGQDLGTPGYYGPKYEQANRRYEGPQVQRVTDMPQLGPGQPGQGTIPQIQGQPTIPGGGGGVPGGGSPGGGGVAGGGNQGGRGQGGNERKFKRQQQRNRGGQGVPWTNASGQRGKNRTGGSQGRRRRSGFEDGGNMFDTLQDIGYDAYAAFQQGGGVPPELMQQMQAQGGPGGQPVEGGQLQPISDNSVEVQGNNPGQVDGVDVGNAMVDDGEMIKDLPEEQGQRVYSDTLKPPGSEKTFAELAKKLEKQKHPEKPEQNERIEYKLDELFQIQQTMNGDSNGETPEQATAGGMDPNEAQNAGKPIAKHGALLFADGGRNGGSLKDALGGFPFDVGIKAEPLDFGKLPDIPRKSDNSSVVKDYDKDWDYKMDGDKIYTKRKDGGSWRDVTKTAAGKAIYNDVFQGNESMYGLEEEAKGLSYEPSEMDEPKLDTSSIKRTGPSNKFATMETLADNGFTPDEFFDLKPKVRRKLSEQMFGRKLMPGDYKRLSTKGSVTQEDIEATGISLDEFYNMKRKDRREFEKENFGSKLRVRDLNAIARDSKYQGGMLQYQGGGYTNMNTQSAELMDVPYPGGRQQEPPYVQGQNGMFADIGSYFGDQFAKPKGGGMSDGMSGVLDGVSQGVTGGMNTFGNSYMGAYGRGTDNEYMGAMGTIGNVGQFGQSAGDIAGSFMGKPGAQYGGDMNLQYAGGGYAGGGFDYRDIGPPEMSFGLPMSMLAIGRRFPTPANANLDYLQRQAGGSWGKFSGEKSKRRESEDMGRKKRKYNDETPGVNTRKRVKQLAIPSKSAMYDARGKTRGKSKSYRMGGWLMPSVSLNKRSLTLSLLSC